MFKAIFVICIQLAACVVTGQTFSFDFERAPLLADSFYLISDLKLAIKENNRVHLNWKITDNSIPEYFNVERSTNGKDFEKVAVVRLLPSDKLYEYIDESPVKGRCIYRVSCAWKDGHQVYSRAVTIQMGGENSFKFYPNPVDNILIIRSDALLDIQITDATGKLRISQNKLQGLQTMNVSNLEKGIYLLRVTNKITNVVLQEKLIKN